VSTATQQSADIVLMAELLTALRALTDRYVQLVGEAGCYRWDPDTDAEVIAARAAIAKAES